MKLLTNIANYNAPVIIPTVVSKYIPWNRTMTLLMIEVAIEKRSTRINVLNVMDPIRSSSSIYSLFL